MSTYLDLGCRASDSVGSFLWQLPRPPATPAGMVLMQSSVPKPLHDLFSGKYLEL